LLQLADIQIVIVRNKTKTLLILFMDLFN